MSKRQRPAEIWYVLLVMALLTLGYALITNHFGKYPAAGSLSGHLLGVAGFVLMIITEILYSLRKHSKRGGRWGKMESWLKFHVFTGIIGPYMVLLHTSWHFNGLAGIVTLLTILIVVSGFIGRYIYTAVPRTLEGVEIDNEKMAAQVVSVDEELKAWRVENSVESSRLPEEIFELPQLPQNPWMLLFGRVFLEWNYRRRLWNMWRQVKGFKGQHRRELEDLVLRRREVRYQSANLVLGRRAIALWHTVHVPLGIALFTTAFIHIGVALYYVTLGR